MNIGIPQGAAALHPLLIQPPISLAPVGVLTSLISAAFYLRVVVVLYMRNGRRRRGARAGCMPRSG